MAKRNISSGMEDYIEMIVALADGAGQGSVGSCDDRNNAVIR